MAVRYRPNITRRWYQSSRINPPVFTGPYAADDKAGKPDLKKDAKTAPHDCKGQNFCKGTGGCGSSDNGCKGKNSCQGKGGCSTMAKSDKKMEGKPKA